MADQADPVERFLGPSVTKVIDKATDAVVEALMAMFDRGVVEGHRRAALAIRQADTSGWPGGRSGDVDGCQELAASIAEQAEPAAGGVVKPSSPPTAEGLTPGCGLPPMIAVRLDNRTGRYVPADPPAPYFEGDEAKPWPPGQSPAEKLSSLWAQPHGGSCTCRDCMEPVPGVGARLARDEEIQAAAEGAYRHGTVTVVPMGPPSPPEGEALGVTDGQRHEGAKVVGDLRDRLRPVRRQHDPGALTEEPDLYETEDGGDRG